MRSEEPEIASFAQRLSTPTRLRAGSELDSSRLAEALPGLREQLHTADSEVIDGPAAEWFLDNFYHIIETARGLAEDLPPEFYRQLPTVEAEGKAEGKAEEKAEGERQPRIMIVADELLRRNPRGVGRTDLEVFLSEFQLTAPLTIGELWALPSFLRLRCIEQIVDAIGRLVPKAGPKTNADEATLLGERVAQAVRTLVELRSIPFRHVFEGASLVHHELSRDPALVYPVLEFETANRYRSTVEELARKSDFSELDVAKRALELAEEHSDDARLGHVGFYLIDRGRQTLERNLDVKRTLRERASAVVRKRATPIYLGLVSLGTALTLTPLVLYLSSVDANALVTGLCISLALVPGSSFAIAWVQWLITQMTAPRPLPRLALNNGISPNLRTMVVVPTLLGNLGEVHELVGILEQHYLANTDQQLQFALLADLLDQKTQTTSGDAALVARAREGIELLNGRYGKNGAGPFHLLVRERQWNAAEGVFMGWERKRGKLEEFNRLLAGVSDTNYTTHVGDPEGILGVRFVITLDSDTELPRDAARRLVSILAHPLNRAEFKNGRVISGYTVLQPRLDINPAASHRSRFTRIFAGDTGIDIYSRAVSDVYQDFFGAGIYVGKGIYDVEAFRQSLDGLIPENALLSHDLFEGIHGRVGLVTDVVLYEDYPTSYLTYARRMHRWIRGDWQLLPWLARQVPTLAGKRANPFLQIDRWKVLDNLRRSLQPVALLMLIVSAWTWLPGSALLWTAGLVLLSAGHVLTGLASRLRGSLNRPLRSTGLRLVDLPNDVRRWAVSWAFLPHEALVVADAVARTLVRVFVTRRRLLEWTSAAQVARKLKKSHRMRAAFWRELATGPILALFTAVIVLVTEPFTLLVALPFLLFWFLSPELAFWQARSPKRAETNLQPDEEGDFRLLARRIWLFFESFVGPGDQWLPPDNVQFDPQTRVAHRTSPTNIGLYLASAAAAHDLGHSTLQDFCLRTRNTFRTLGKVERYRGQLLNWYDTETLVSLSPKYVSTVDNGNFLASLIVVRQACSEYATGPVINGKQWRGLGDAVQLLTHAASELTTGDKDLETVSGSLKTLSETVVAASTKPLTWVRALEEIEALVDQLSGAFSTVVGADGAGDGHEVESWLKVVQRQALGFRQQLTEHASWYFTLAEPPLSLLKTPEAQRAHQELLRTAESACVDELHTLRETAQGFYDLHCLAVTSAKDDSNCPADVWWRAFTHELEEGIEYGDARVEELLDLGAQCEVEIERADYRFLYDEDAHQLFIGFDVGAAKPDSHHYDLLASEARLSSLTAIALGQVPLKHWFHLGRPMAKIAGETGLLSWSGTMFEYLMPLLFTRSFDKTLLGRSARAAVDLQIEHGKAHKIPWGVSESGFAAKDREGNYQYRAFGVPGLGLKRGLGDDTVIAPYASLLAVGLRPHAVLANLQKFREVGALGPYGPYEAIDFTRGRADPEKGTVVRSYMAHHQGMALVALANLLEKENSVTRFRADARMQTVLHLLQEKQPLESSARQLDNDVAPVPGATARVSAPASWSPHRASLADPQTHLLSGGGLSRTCDAFGRGRLWKEGIEVRPWERGQRSGAFCVYIQEGRETRTLFGTLAAEEAAERRVTYWPHMIQVTCREQSLFVQQEIALSVDEAVETHRVHLRNESDTERTVYLSACADLALGPAGEHRRHPAFSRLFLGTRSQQGGRVLLCHRRRRAPDERWPVVGQAVWGGEDISFDCSRETFLGRGASMAQPKALRTFEPLSASEGHVLEACFAQRVRLTLAAGQEGTLTWLTAVGDDENKVLALLKHGQSPAAFNQTCDLSRRRTGQRLAQLGIGSPEVAVGQRLLSRLVHRCSRQPSKHASRRRLWGHGISGDFPILLIHRRSENEPLIESAVRLQALWHAQLFQVDIVIVDHDAPSYVDEARNEVHRLVRKNGLEHTGNLVAVASASHLTQDDLEALAAAAAVVLDTGAGSLEQQVADQPELRTQIPHFVPTRAIADASGETSLETGKLDFANGEVDFENGLGGFGLEGKEYVIHLKQGETTPAPWSNVLSNAGFGCLVTASGLGCTWATNASENRLTPWFNDPVEERPSEGLYLRDEETGAVFSPLSGLLRRSEPGGGFQVRHGVGYTVFTHSCHGLRLELEVRVDPERPLKILALKIQNLTARERRLTVTYFADWVLGVRPADDSAFVVQEFVPEVRALLASNGWSLDAPEQVAFLAASEPVHGFTTSSIEFLGEGGIHDPEGLARLGLSNFEQGGPEPCAALQVHVDLGASSHHDLHFSLGWGAQRDAALALARLSLETTVVESTRERSSAYWETVLGAVQVSTPDPATNYMLNTWALYQSVSSRVLARTGFYQSSGAVGFRDQLQDVMALAISAPTLVRRHILDAAAHQFQAGDVLHWWHPPGGKGVRTRCSDDLLWLPYVVAHYVSSTGDLDILSEPVPFLTGPELGDDQDERYDVFAESSESAPLAEHCLRAFWRSKERASNGLPPIGSCDWNDGMNLVRGQSVWLGWFLCATVKRFVDACGAHLESSVVDELEAFVPPLKDALERAWDGKWYHRAYFEDGTPLGSHVSEEARIDSIAQSWAVLSGESEPSRARTAMQSVIEHLVDEEAGLVRLLWPPFDRSEQEPGYIKGYPPGIRENGAQYTHAATWVVWALLEIDRPEDAERIFRSLNPISHSDSKEGAALYRTEPYALCGDVYSVGPHRGRGGWSWYTGAAGWYYRLGIEGLLGLQIRWPYLMIRPKIPAAWPGFSASLHLGGARFVVEVENAKQGTTNEETEVFVDGTKLDSNRIDLTRYRGEHQIRVLVEERVTKATEPQPPVTLTARSNPQRSSGD